jgi:hypothetical protein
MERRKFISIGGVFFASLLLSTNLKANLFLSKIVNEGFEFKNRLSSIIQNLKNKGTSIVRAVMNGETYKFDSYTHYPYDGGIKDKNTGNLMFFHIHRTGEYGHFHTFAIDETGNLVHLVLISMDKDGNPISLATVNRWVTGDKYVKSGELKILSEKFYIEPTLFNNSAVIEFVNGVFKAFKTEIDELFDDRDKWIKTYVSNNFNEPFEDRNFEILSFKQIDLGI